MAALTIKDLREAAARHAPDPACPCGALRCRGWESLPATFDGAYIGMWLPGRKRSCLWGLASNTATISVLVVAQ